MTEEERKHLYEVLGPDPRGTGAKVYKKPCGPCPSMYPLTPRMDNGMGDEMIDILGWGYEARIRTVFRCAWRQKASCRGVCDRMDVTHEFEEYDGR